jgi:hypothetical protein
LLNDYGDSISGAGGQLYISTFPEYLGEVVICKSDGSTEAFDDGVIPYDSVAAWKFYYIADEYPYDEDMQVSLTMKFYRRDSVYAGSTEYVTAINTVMVLLTNFCPVVTLSDSSISPGDTITVDVWGKRDDGRLIDVYDNNTFFDISLDSTGASYGDLLVYGERYDYYQGALMPIQFVANESIDSNVVSVTIGASKSEIVAASIKGKDTTLKNIPAGIKGATVSGGDPEEPSPCGPAQASVEIQAEGCPVVELSDSSIAPGDTIEVKVRMKLEDGALGDYSASQIYHVEIKTGGEYGDLLINGEHTDAADGVTIPVKFIADSTFNADSAVVTILAYPVEPDPNASVSNSGKTVAGDGKTVANAASKQQYVMKALSNQCPPEPPEVDVEIKPFTILLGETRYYYVKSFNDKLNIFQTSDPTSNPGVGAIGFTVDKYVNPKETNLGKKMGVYWEEQYPENSGNDFTGMKALPPGMIRLIGRYWTSDSVYKIVLTAKEVATGNTISRIIEVKRPDKLGDDYGPLTDDGTVRRTSVKDVEGNVYNLDNIIITQAGKYGIPPQIIKADIQQESSFQPGYRWEPFVDADIQIQDDPTSKYMDDDFRYKKTSTDEGTPEVPTDHTNVIPLHYPQKDYSTIWERLFKYSYTLNAITTSNQYPISLWFRDKAINGWNDHYNEKLKDLKKEGVEDDQEAVDFANDWLRDDYQEGIMSEGIAQTRTAATYGLMQLQYFTAVDQRGYLFERIAGTQNYLPEYLNIAETNLTYAVPYLLSLVDDELEAKGDEQGKTYAWSQGFEKTLLVALNRYNGKSGKKQRYTWHYGFDVFKKVYQYLPK